MGKIEISREIEALGAIAAAMEALSPEARTRVMKWMADAFRAEGSLKTSFPRDGQVLPAESPQFETLTTLLDAAQPTSTRDRVLVIAYWFQHIQRQPDITGAQINAELKNLGHGVQNITDTINKLMGRQPQPIRQTRKEGTTKQARKRYALTEAGRKRVFELMSGTESAETD